MAVYHCHTHPISRSGKSGSAIACAAYRAAEALEQIGRGEDENKALSTAQLAAYRTGEAVADGSGKVHDYSRKSGVAHTEIILPKGVDAPWTQDRAALWNQAEGAETRKNSRVAREWRIALPHELDGTARIAAAREFAGALVELYGIAADVAVHEPSRSGDQRNWHAHVLCTTRQITSEGFTGKAELEWSNTNLAKEGKPYSSLQIREVRMLWQEIANEHLAEAGQEARIDHRSLAEQGIALEATRTVHVGQHYAELRDLEIGTERILPVERLDFAASERNAEVIEADPSFILDKVVGQESAFQRRDVARALHRYVNEDWDRFDRTLDRVMADPSLVQLMEAGKTSDTGREVEAVWSTKAVALREASMLDCAERLATSGAGGFSNRAVGKGIAAAERGGITLSDEQREAVETIGHEGQVAVLRGVAGTGKTTALTAVREAAEADGLRIVGGALAGKAARELADGSGIEARTLASWERSWEAGFDRLGKGDVFVVDEAGMVGASQMGRILSRVEEAGAKVVLTGDERQLQPIEAGAAFRTIRNRAEDRGDFAELGEVRRQTEGWQREASQLFGMGDAAKALDAYNDRGEVRFENSVAQTRTAIVETYFAKLDEARERSSDGVRGTDHIVTAYRNVDVDQLNAAIRSERVARGELGEDATFQTDKGERVFASGDKVLLTRNDRTLGLANGDRVEVIGAETDRLDLRMKDGREVSLSAEAYDGVQPGYAVTTHKAQGMTVDRVHVMAGDGMHASLAYVAMTRQRDGATLYAAREHFRNYEALRGAIGHQQDASAVGDYLPHENAVAAVQERIAETDASRGLGQSVDRSEALQAAQHDGPDAGEVRSAMRDAWRTAAERLSEASHALQEIQEPTRSFVDRATDVAERDRDPASEIVPRERASENDGAGAHETEQEVRSGRAAEPTNEEPARDAVLDHVARSPDTIHGVEEEARTPSVRSNEERRDDAGAEAVGPAREDGSREPSPRGARSDRSSFEHTTRAEDQHARSADRGQEAEPAPSAEDRRAALAARIKAHVADARTAEPSRLERLRSLFRRDQGQDPAVNAAEGASMDQGRENREQRREASPSGSAPADHRVSIHDRDTKREHDAASRAASPERSEPRSTAEQAEMARDGTGGHAARETLRQRLRDHAAGREGDTAEPERRDRLRQKLADHAAGKTPGRGHDAQERGSHGERARDAETSEQKDRTRGRDHGAEQ